MMMMLENDRVDKIDQSDANQGDNQESQSISFIDIIEDDNEEPNVIRDKESNDEPEIVILSNNEYHNSSNNNSVNRNSNVNNGINNNDDDDDISIIATREQPIRERIVVDLDNEPEIINISNNNNSSNDIDDDLTIIEERNIPSVYVNEDSNLQTIPLHLPGGNSIQININDYERPNRTSFLNGETRRNGISNSNYRRNIFSTGDRIRLIRDLENIYSRGSNSVPSDIRSYIMERLSNGNSGNSRDRHRRRQRNVSSRNTNRDSQSRRLRRRLNHRYEYENPWVYDYNYEYGYEDYEDEDDYNFNFGFGFGFDETTNQRSYYEENDERRTQNIINFIEQRENRERDIKIQKLKEKSEPLKQKFIDSANNMEKLGEFTSNFTAFTSNEESNDNNSNDKYDSIVPSCVLCGVELGLGIPSNYDGITEEDKSLTFENLVTKYGYHCPYQSLYKPTQLDKDLSKRTFISKNCGHLYCGRCFARIDNAKGKSKLSKKKLAELKGPSNPNNYGPRVCPATNCTTIIRAKGRLKEVYF